MKKLKRFILLFILAIMLVLLTGCGKEQIQEAKEEFKETFSEEGWDYSIIAGKEDDVPVPKSFYYVGGTKSSGVIISDNAEDARKGRSADDIKGNQFVWIPIDDIQDVPDSTLEQLYSVSSVNDDISSVEYQGLQKSILQYGGFYVSRYEMTIADDGIVQNRQIGIKKVNNVTWQEAKDFSDYMYLPDVSSVDSHLMYGSEWDAILAWYTRGTDRQPRPALFENSSSIGDYNDTPEATRAIENFDMINNIKGIAGGLAEWTQERVLNEEGNISRYIVRGGSSNGSGDAYPAVYRDPNPPDITSEYIGFRTCLYITPTLQQVETETINPEWEATGKVSEQIDGVPIPKGYSYLGGTKDGGLTIKDNANGNDKLKFIWVPVDNTTVKNISNAGDALKEMYGSTYKLDQFGNEIISEEVKASIDLFKGFYVSEAELGYEVQDGAVTVEYSNVKRAMKDSYAEEGDYYRGLTTTDTSKVKRDGETQELKLTYEDMLKKAAQVGQFGVTTSHMMYGAEWDAIMVWLMKTGYKGDEAKIISDSSLIGKYQNTDKLAPIYAYADKLSNNIWGLAGNLAEVTQEKIDGSPILRGGHYAQMGNNYFMSRRFTVDNIEQPFVGFRAALCIDVPVTNAPVTNTPVSDNPTTNPPAPNNPPTNAPITDNPITNPPINTSDTTSNQPNSIAIKEIIYLPTLNLNLADTDDLSEEVGNLNMRIKYFHELVSPFNSYINAINKYVETAYSRMNSIDRNKIIELSREIANSSSLINSKIDSINLSIYNNTVYIIRLKNHANPTLPDLIDLDEKITTLISTSNLYYDTSEIYDQLEYIRDICSPLSEGSLEAIEEFVYTRPLNP